MSQEKHPLPSKQPLVPDSVLQPKLQRAIYLPRKVTIKTGWTYIKKEKRVISFWCSLCSLRGLGKTAEISWWFVKRGSGGRCMAIFLVLQLSSNASWPTFTCEIEPDRVCLLQRTLNLQVSSRPPPIAVGSRPQELLTLPRQVSIGWVPGTGNWLESLLSENS